jgi:hypothetical protein
VIYLYGKLGAIAARRRIYAAQTLDATHEGSATLPRQLADGMTDAVDLLHEVNSTLVVRHAGNGSSAGSSRFFEHIKSETRRVAAHLKPRGLRQPSGQ